MGRQKLLRLIEASSVILFFIQSLRVIFSVMFGIIYDQVFAGSPNAWLAISNLLLLAAFIAPALVRCNAGRYDLAFWAGLASVGRVLLTLNDAAVRFWSALVLIAAGGLYLGLLYKKGWPFILPGLSIALVCDQFLRLAGNTYDISLRPGWLPVQILLAIGLFLISIWLSRQPLEGERTAPRFSTGVGIGGLLFLEVSLLGLPNGVARWTGGRYEPIAVVILAMTLVWAILTLSNRMINRWMEAPLVGWLLMMLLAGCLLIAYFTVGWQAALALLVAQGIVLLAFTYLFSARNHPGISCTAWLASGMVFFLLLNYFNAFAFTYPYSLPLMRGLGWLVYLIAGLVVGISLLLHPAERNNSSISFGKPIWLALGGLLMGLAALVLVWPRPANQLPETVRLRVATYNIHYGYDTYWHFTLEQIAQTIAASGADFIALQEVDTGRLTSYGVDDAVYLSKRLRMNVHYLPTVERLTGIAILYRGEAQAQESRLLTSLQEQTGILHVALQPGGQTVHAFGVWMGLSDEDTLTQINEALEFIGGRSPAVFGGDFNAGPDSPVAQAVRAAGFVDPFAVLGGEPPPTDPAINPTARIDFVWARGLQPIQAWVPDSLASDHRMVVVDLKIK